MLRLKCTYKYVYISLYYVYIRMSTCLKCTRSEAVGAGERSESPDHGAGVLSRVQRTKRKRLDMALHSQRPIRTTYKANYFPKPPSFGNRALKTTLIREFLLLLSRPGACASFGMAEPMYSSLNITQNSFSIKNIHP